MISLFAFVSVVVLIFAGGVIYHGCDRREDKVILWGYRLCANPSIHDW
ncbi:hypothetical protein ALHIDCOG_00264 [Klebsiella phage CPRSB]|nr:hypothetical protein ALHIDCOG_00264 [Klebsiella phage CPRSB]